MKRQKGITLIALVITIIVLLILAGVSISMVVGQNGILSNAQNSVIADTKAKEEEGVKRSALAAMSISSSKGNIALENAYFNQELKNEFGEGNYLLEEQTDKFTVTIVGTGNSYEIDKIGNVSGQPTDEGNVGESGWEGFYPDADTQPTDPSRFLYTVISEEDKTIAITGIKEDYVSEYYLFDWEYDGISIPEGIQTELIIPYEIDGYSVKEIKILNSEWADGCSLNTVLNIELPKGVEIICSEGGAGAFEKAYNLISISIPDTVTTIESGAFWLCSRLQTVNYEGTQEQWDAINIGSSNSSLTNATLVPNYTGE